MSALTARPAARRVAVSGAGGFIGLPLLAELARGGAEVHAFAHGAPRARVRGVHWHRIDLADGAAVEALMGRLAPEQLVHLAWYTAHGSFWRAPENLDWVGFSLRLMRAFVRSGGRRAVMLGSCAEYDWTSADRPLAETRARLAPATLYGAAKDALRRVAAAYAEQENVELAWGRPFLLYGPRESAARLVPSVIRPLLAGQVAEISSGSQVRDFMHVEDVAGALAALLDSSVTGEVNIASGAGIALSDLVERIARIVGGPGSVRRGALPDRVGDPSSLVADIARLRDEVGYRPRWTLDAGLEATVRWWRGACSDRAPRVHPATQRERIAQADALVD